MCDGLISVDKLRSAALSGAAHLQKNCGSDAGDDDLSPGAEEVGGSAVPQARLRQTGLLQLPPTNAIYNYLTLQWRCLVENLLAGDRVHDWRRAAVPTAM